MPKRKSDCGPALGVSLASFDAALDLLACDTFTKLDHLASKFEAAAGIKLNEGVVSQRWEEALRRYTVMKSMDDLCCSMSKAQGGTRAEAKNEEGKVKMEDGDADGQTGTVYLDLRHRRLRV